ncbi:hypothetical protein DRO54_03110 [Candidatus Bathyarchaeota archaeon]|nr:MAG: hypothetical protein DRO54_03110 [Candidatus Bathyarchaeota archaeon]
MPRKRTKKRKNEQITDEETLPSTPKEDEETETLKAKLESIKNSPEVIGYIIRNSRSATIDAKDPTKIIDYAILSSSTIEMAEKLTEAFQLGTAEKIILEGENAKLLSLSINNNSISIFTEKNADTNKIYKKLI